MKRYLISLLLAASVATTAFSQEIATDSTAAGAADSLTTVPTVADSLSADTAATPAKLSFYERRTARMRRNWDHLVPSLATVQFAGSIGMFSVGMGWHYGRRDRWETELLVGWMPHDNGSSYHYTLTLKERYVPWRLALSSHRRWEVEPLTAGAFVNMIFGEGFWRHAPSKYTKGYYGFNTKLRYNIFLGQRIRYNIPQRRRLLHKSISLYYELSTCDLYLVSAIPNKRVRLGDILSLAIGTRLELF